MGVVSSHLRSVLVTLRLGLDYEDKPERGMEDTIHEMAVYRCRCPQDSIDICGETRGDQGHCQDHESR